MISKETQRSLGIGEIVSLNTARVIRSHRRPPSHINSFISLVIIGCVAAAIAVSAVPLERPIRQPVKPPESPVAVAPLSLPNPEPVEAPVSVSGSQTSGAVVQRESQRATRTERPETETKSLPKVEAVIAFALAQQGDRYVFAAAGPNAYDCSGLVMAAFATVGVKLPHYTGTMLNYGRSVSRSQMQRGDAVWLSYNHVAIYLGNNQMIAASSSKGKVTVQTVYAFYAARRLL